MIEETCPKCGGTLDILSITTNPPIPARRCRDCGWHWEGKPMQVIRIPFQPLEEKEAIEILNDIAYNAGGADRDKITWAISLALSALEKQIAKKPLQACGHATEFFKKDIPLMNYCPICGQKIDWGKMT